MLPEILSDGIERLSRELPFSKLEKAARELSSAYRKQTEGQKTSRSYMATRDQKIAYLALRMPATFAAISECLKKVRAPIQTVLDAGSGPGTAFWAAWSCFPELKKADLIEKDDELIQIGKEFLKALPSFQASYQKQDLSSFTCTGNYDLAIAAYVLSKLSESGKSKRWKSFINPLPISLSSNPERLTATAPS